MGLSVAEVLARVARPHDAIQGLVPGLAGVHDVDDSPEARTIPGLVVYRYDSPLFFANAQDFKRRATAAVDAVTEQRGPVSWFVLNTEANVEVDITALDAVDSLRRELERRGIVFALARVKQDLLDDLDAYGLTAAIGEGPDLPDPAHRRGGVRGVGPGPSATTPVTQAAWLWLTPERTTATGQCAWCRTAWLTDPRSRPVKPRPPIAVLPVSGHVADGCPGYLRHLPGLEALGDLLRLP